MKKKILIGVIAVVLGSGSLNAQSDGFFASSYSEYRDIENDWSLNMPLLPGSHGYIDDYSCVEQEAPLGNGLLILGVLALGYRKLRIKN
ncbi:MAG: hypothetical protein IJA42_04720 [Bacteroidales bacterium]|nr:hypothetical protein [Bacteroidales bacterium]